MHRRSLPPVLGVFLAASVLGASGLRADGGPPDYGYLLGEDASAAVWWAEGAYKVFRQDPVPAKRSEAVLLRAARNEYEPFLLVIRPKVRLNGVRAETGPLTHETGASIPACAVSVSRVEYVAVARPTDAFGAAGDWPDPLPPCEGPFAAPAGENAALWITVRVPRDVPPGRFRGEVVLSSGSWRRAVPVVLEAWAFALPDRPSIRSAFGLSAEDIRRYHNLETREELEKVYDLYLRNFREHRVAPISLFQLDPPRVEFSGIPWLGGEFVADAGAGGTRALLVADADPAGLVEAVSAADVAVEPGVEYRLSFRARTGSDGQEYTVFVSGADAGGEPLPAENRLEVFKGSREWRAEAFDVRPFPAEVRTVRVHLLPVFRDASGSRTGNAWFDDLVLAGKNGGPNILPGGDCETDPAAIGVRTDFEAFDRAAGRFLDEYGFNAFNLPVQGLGSGSFFSRTPGLFGGFRQGTPEYDRLLSRYLSQVEIHLAENGWLGKEYIYWFDEPDPKDYPFVREGMTNIRKNAPRLTRFITEHMPGPDIMDVSEIGCTIFHKIDPAAIAELKPKGRQFWSYLCTGPKGPWVTLFIDHPAVNLRLWLWMSHAYGLEGILVWRANYWTSGTVFPPGVLQNPWRDPMSYTVGYGVPYGKVLEWGNGDGRFIYPPNRDPGRDRTKYLGGPVNSIRWEILREGIEDYEYFKLLEKSVAAAVRGRLRDRASEARKLLAVPESVFKSGREYSRDPLVMLDYRRRVAEAIEALTVTPEAGGL